MPFVQTSGARIYYEDAGHGPPVLLIQGIGVIGQGWQPQVRGLADRYRLILLDNRGIGASTIEPGPAGAVTLANMAADATAVLDALHVERAHVVGHSMGGVIAQQLALTAPARVRSLSLLCTVGRGQDAVRITPEVLWRGLRMNLGSKRSRRRAFVELILPAATPDKSDKVDYDQLAAELAPLFGRDLAEHPPIILKQVRAMAKHDTSHRLGELGSIATLVVSAKEDRVTLARYGRALAAAIPGARYVELPAAGHGVPIKSPERINDLLAQHFAAADAAAPAAPAAPAGDPGAPSKH